MYNVSISFGTMAKAGATPVFLLVLVTDATTATPIGGLSQDQFTVHAFVPQQGEPVLPLGIGDFFELATVTQSNYPSPELLPGVYFLQVTFPVAPEITKGSYAFAVTVSKTALRLRGEPPQPPIVLGLGVGTYLSLTGTS